VKIKILYYFPGFCIFARLQQKARESKGLIAGLHDEAGSTSPSYIDERSSSTNQVGSSV